MIEKLVSNLIATGFVESSGTDGTIRRPSYGLVGDDLPNVSYFRGALARWGTASCENQRELRVILAILNLLKEGPETEAEVLRGLTGESEDAGVYDSRDKFAFRTIRELLKLLKFAGFVDQAEGKYCLTSDGLRVRPKLQRGDLLRTAEDLIQRLGPDTDALDVSVKLACAKYYMYLECGGKGKDLQFVKRISRGLRKPTKSDPFRLNPRIYRALADTKRRKRNAIEQIQQIDGAIGNRSATVRGVSKLEAVLSALQRGDRYEANRLLDQSGSSFSWDSIKQLTTPGLDYSVRPAFRPHAWQIKALSVWNQAGRRGVLQVVTGAGKTVLALQALEKVWNERPNDLRATILVPTKVLMYQWAAALVRVLGVPTDDIGLRGDGHKDSFRSGKKVVVTIVNSAIRERHLTKDVDALPSSIAHFLIADECHRYRGEEFRKCFDCRIDLSLGLSATPDDPEAPTSGQQDEVDVVTERLGSTIFNYSYREALADSIIQKFVVKYVGVDLLPPERETYDWLSKRIAKTIEKLLARYGPLLEPGPTGSFDRRLQLILKRGENPDPAIHDYFRLVRERKNLVFRAVNRKRCYLDMISGLKESDRVIVFHERIEDLEEIVAPLERRSYVDDPDIKTKRDPAEHEADKKLEELFLRPGFRAVMYHSGHSRQFWNEIAMEWFRSDVASAMLSVKALVEGVDVPKANVGIVRTSSSSVRQRIQTTGRVLRRAHGKDRPSELFVLYVRDSTDERIFADVDWKRELGSSSIESIHWIAPDAPGQVEGNWVDLAGKLPEVHFRELERKAPVDLSALEFGDRFPGGYFGREYHVDSRGRPFHQGSNGRKYITNRAIVRAASEIQRLKGGGKFVITAEGAIVTKVKGHGLIFLGITEKVEFSEDLRRRTSARLASKFPELAKLVAQSGSGNQTS